MLQHAFAAARGFFFQDGAGLSAAELASGGFARVQALVDAACRPAADLVLAVAVSIPAPREG